MYLKNKVNLLILIAVIILIIYLYSSKKIESFEESEESEESGFDLNYINRRKCVIAVSVPNNNTYTGTQQFRLGTIFKNKNTNTAYQPSNNNINNGKYDTVFLYTGKSGSVAPDKININTENGVDFLSTWEIIKESCNKDDNSYLIRNIETDRLLGCGKITKNAPVPIAFLNGKESITRNNLWEINRVGVNEYTIKNITNNLYLFSTGDNNGVHVTNNYDFVTNTYKTSLKNKYYKNAPDYNNYGEVNVRKTPFNWFIAPLPPQNGQWRKTSHYLGSDYNNNPSLMSPCVPLENDNQEISYPWYRNSQNTNQCIKNLPIEYFYLQKSLKPVYKLGKVGISPWRSCPGFKNQNAQWIWYTKDAQNSAPAGTGKIFVYIYENNTNLTTCNINSIVDNNVTIKVNNKNVGTQSGGWGGSGGVVSASLIPGINIFSFSATNAGSSPNPAGLLVTVFNPDNNQILFSTGDNGWGYTYGSNL